MRRRRGGARGRRPPTGRNAVRLLREDRLNGVDFSLFDFKQLADFKGKRMAQGGRKDLSVGQLDRLHRAGMIEKREGERQAALAVDNHETALADLGDDLEKPGLELRLAAQSQ